ncbi:hypothetical protein TYRP_011084 [Tyrophagus putrescentiae]|nr:hypothetical protein TYRP_011084 [Tyrophagus putrescentiae]
MNKKNLPSFLASSVLLLDHHYPGDDGSNSSNRINSLSPNTSTAHSARLCSLILIVSQIRPAEESICGMPVRILVRQGRQLSASPLQNETEDGIPPFCDDNPCQWNIFLLVPLTRSDGINRSRGYQQRSENTEDDDAVIEIWAAICLKTGTTITTTTITPTIASLTLSSPIHHYHITSIIHLSAATNISTITSSISSTSLGGADGIIIIIIIITGRHFSLIKLMFLIHIFLYYWWSNPQFGG